MVFEMLCDERQSLRAWQASCLACGNFGTNKAKSFADWSLCDFPKVGVNHASDPWIATRRLGVGQ